MIHESGSISSNKKRDALRNCTKRKVFIDRKVEESYQKRRDCFRQEHYLFGEREGGLTMQITYLLLGKMEKAHVTNYFFDDAAQKISD